MRANGIDELSSLADEKIARPEDHRASLLAFGLGSDETHRGPAGRFDDGFGVGCIILLPFDERFYISGGNKRTSRPSLPISRAQ